MQSRAACEYPDCDDYDACIRCKECDMLLCEGHIVAHNRGKGTRHHTLLSLRSVGDHRVASPNPKCQIHAMSDLVKFCETWDVYMCDVCLIKYPLHASHDLVDFAETAEIYREKFSKRLASLADDNIDEELALKQVWLEEQIAKINREAEVVSAAISADFDKMREQLRTREEKLMADLDVLRWAPVKSSEKRIEELHEMRGKLKTSRNLVERLDLMDLLRHAKAVARALEAATAGTCEDEEECMLDVRYLTFSEYCQEEFQNVGELAMDDKDSGLQMCSADQHMGIPASETDYTHFQESQKSPHITLSLKGHVASSVKREQSGNDGIPGRVVATPDLHHVFCSGTLTAAVGELRCRIQFLDNPLSSRVVLHGERPCCWCAMRRQQYEEQLHVYHG